MHRFTIKDANIIVKWVENYAVASVWAKQVLRCHQQLRHNADRGNDA